MVRKLTITIDSDWKAALRGAAAQAKAGLREKRYQGEVLNFESAGAFFSHLTERRWALITELLGEGVVGVRELARRLGRDVKRVHEDASALVALGLLERTELGALFCPYVDIHVDMHLMRRAA